MPYPTRSGLKLECWEAMGPTKVWTVKELGAHLQWKRQKIYRVLEWLVEDGEVYKEQAVGRGRHNSTPGLYTRMASVPPKVEAEETTAEARARRWEGLCGRCLREPRMEGRWLGRECFHDLKAQRAIDALPAALQPMARERDNDRWRRFGAMSSLMGDER